MKLIENEDIAAVMAIPLHRQKERYLSDLKAWIHEQLQETRLWIQAYDLKGEVATPQEIEDFIMPRIAAWMARQPDTDDYLGSIED